MRTRVKKLHRLDLVFIVPFLGVLACGWPTHAQTESAALPDAPQARSESPDAATIRNTPRNILRDQKAIWTSPFRMHPGDLKWVAPLLVATSAAIATDHWALKDVVSHDANFNNSNTDASNIAIGGFIAVPVLLYGVGHFGNDDHARESGILGAEALVDGVVVEQGMKLIFWRERPTLDQGRGRFFQSRAGIDSSFPSSHSVLAWSAASVIADEYPHPVVEILAYSMATGVSLTRIMGQQHFPSDVLVGSAAGWLVGHYVYRHHHRRMLSGR